MRVAVLVSGGKDSTATLLHALLVGADSCDSAGLPSWKKKDRYGEMRRWLEELKAQQPLPFREELPCPT